MKFPARVWNGLMDRLRGSVLLEGENARFARTAWGVLVSGDARAGHWEHPWRVMVRWVERKGWRVQVRAGFVNGMDPTVGGVPLLDLEPEDGLAMPWQEMEGRPLPFFEALGVRTTGEGVEVNAGMMTMRVVDTSWEDAFRPAARRLWSADLQLSVARSGLVGTVDIVSGDGMAGNVAVYSPGLSSMVLSSRGSRAVLLAVPRVEPPRFPSLMDRMLGYWEDPQEDILPVARVWMLSPPEFEGDGPDESFTAFVQHFVFWNLAHASRLPEIPQVLKPITLVTGLAAGVGDRINAALLAPMNDRAQQINAALNAVSPDGKFWTI